MHRQVKINIATILSCCLFGFSYAKLYPPTSVIENDNPLVEVISAFIFTQYNEDVTSGIDESEFSQALNDLMAIMPSRSILHSAQNGRNQPRSSRMSPNFRPPNGDQGFSNNGSFRSSRQRPSEMGPPNISHAATHLVALYDTNKDNELSEEELKQLFQTVKRYRDPRPNYKQ